jgi:predicted dehydrogenase/endonuclease IV
MVGLTNLDLVEFHMSYKDMEEDIERHLGDRAFDLDLVIHSPELFAGDHIMDLCAPDEEYRKRSIEELRRVVDLTRRLTPHFTRASRPMIIINAGGFSLDRPIDPASRSAMYDLIADSLAQIDQTGVEIIPQTMPPFPWHFGGQRYHNLFLSAQDIEGFCKAHGYRVCLDISHSQLACTHQGESFKEFLEVVAPLTGHLHMVDAEGVDGEGLQIGEGTIDFAMVAEVLDRAAPDALLERGVPTFVEKPVVTARAHLERLEALAAAPALPPTQVGCVLRFLPAVRLLKQWLDEGRCGNIVRASFEAGQYLPDWRPAQDYRQSYSASAAGGGGVVFDLVHELDLASFLFGDLSLLHAAAARRSGLEIACEDSALITLASPEGILVGVQLDYVSRRPVRRIDVVGDLGTVRLDFVARRLEQVSSEGVVETHAGGFDLDEAYREELTDLIDAEQRGGKTWLPLGEGLKATRLAIDAREMAGLAACAPGEMP